MEITMNEIGSPLPGSKVEGYHNFLSFPAMIAQ